jgi:thiamine transporter ThiT
MDLAHKILVALHLLGMAAVVGGWVAVRAGRVVTPTIVWGARAQIVTGILLVGLAEMSKTDDFVVNNVKVGVKLLIALVVAGAAEVGARKTRQGEDGSRHLDVAGGAGLANVLVATLW